VHEALFRFFLRDEIRYSKAWVEPSGASGVRMAKGRPGSHPGCGRGPGPSGPDVEPLSVASAGVSVADQHNNAACPGGPDDR